MDNNYGNNIQDKNQCIEQERKLQYVFYKIVEL